MTRRKLDYYLNKKVNVLLKDESLLIGILKRKDKKYVIDDTEFFLSEIVSVTTGRIFSTKHIYG